MKLDCTTIVTGIMSRVLDDLPIKILLVYSAKIIIINVLPTKLIGLIRLD